MALSDAIDESKPVQGSPTTQSVRENFAAAKSAIAQLELTAGVGPRGFSIRAYSTAANMTNISAIAGMIVGDYVVNTGTATRTILGVSTVVGAMVQSTSATAGVAAGNAPTGAPGAAATVTVGTVTTGAPAAPATVTNSGTTAAAVLNFTIPQGQTGTGGSGITEAQAVEAVRTAAPVFREQNETVATAVPATLPNVAVTAPTLTANWTLTGGSGATGTYSKTASNLNVLAYPLNVAAEQLFEVEWTGTQTTSYGRVFLRNGAANTTDQLEIGSTYGPSYPPSNRTVLPRAYTHLVVVPNAATFVGTFTLTRVGQSTGSLNSLTLALKDYPVRIRDGGTNPSLFIGGGGRFATGSDNLAIGRNALNFSATAGASIAIGNESMNRVSACWNNVCIGRYSGSNISTGSYNTYIGGFNNGSAPQGNYNTGIGFASVCYNPGGPTTAFSSNTGVGSYCLYSPGGQENTAIGSNVFGWFTGNGNVGMGYDVMNGSSSSSYNVAIGHRTFAGVGDSEGNVGVGANAGRFLANGTTSQQQTENSIFIGYNSRGSASQNQENQIVIGAYATGGGSDTITLGNNSINSLRCNVTSISSLSDSRVKEDIQPADLDRCLDTVKNLTLHRWAWAEIAGIKRDKHVTGFLADDVEKLFPKAVTKSDEWLARYDAEGKPLKKIADVLEAVPELIEHREADPSEAKHHDPKKPVTMRAVRQEVLDGVEIKALSRLDPTELLPTLWGAVQKLIEKVEALGQPQPAQQAAVPRRR